MGIEIAHFNNDFLVNFNKIGSISNNYYNSSSLFEKFVFEDSFYFELFKNTNKKTSETEYSFGFHHQDPDSRQIIIIPLTQMEKLPERLRLLIVFNLHHFMGMEEIF